MLNGGAGDDILTGGAGKDRFIFAPLQGSALITDFEDGMDRIDFSAFNFADTAAALAFADDVSGDVVFTFSAGNVLTVENMTKAQLSDADLVI